MALRRKVWRRVADVARRLKGASHKHRVLTCLEQPGRCNLGLVQAMACTMLCPQIAKHSDACSAFPMHGETEGASRIRRVMALPIVIGNPAPYVPPGGTKRLAVDCSMHPSGIIGRRAWPAPLPPRRRRPRRTAGTAGGAGRARRTASLYAPSQCRSVSRAESWFSSRHPTLAH